MNATVSGLVRSLALHFYVSSVLVLWPEEDPGDGDLAARGEVELVQDFGVPVAHFYPSDSLDRVRAFSGGEEVTFVVCQDSDSAVSLGLGFGQKIYYLLPGAVENFPKDLRLDSNWLTYRVTGELVDVRESYRIKRGPVMTRNLGIWTEQHGLRVAETKWERRSNLGGVAVVATVLPWEPIIGVGADGSVSGVMPEVFAAMGQMLNFTVEYTSPEDGQWGSEKEDGEFTGIVN